MAMIVDMVSWLCLTGGALLCAAGGIGMVRFPDVYTRSHAAGVIDTGGAFMILLGLAVQAGFTLVTVKLFLIGLLLFFTTPTSTHALVKGALSGGQKPIVRDDPDKDNGVAP